MVIVRAPVWRSPTDQAELDEFVRIEREVADKIKDSEREKPQRAKPTERIKERSTNQDVRAEKQISLLEEELATLRKQNTELESSRANYERQKKLQQQQMEERKKQLETDFEIRKRELEEDIKRRSSKIDALRKSLKEETENLMEERRKATENMKVNSAKKQEYERLMTEYNTFKAEATRRETHLVSQNETLKKKVDELSLQKTDLEDRLRKQDALLLSMTSRSKPSNIQPGGVQPQSQPQSQSQSQSQPHQQQQQQQQQPMQAPQIPQSKQGQGVPTVGLSTIPKRQSVIQIVQPPQGANPGPSAATVTNNTQPPPTAPSSSVLQMDTIIQQSEPFSTPTGLVRAIKGDRETHAPSSMKYKQVEKDGRVDKKFDNGARLIIYPNGTEKFMHPDGIFDVLFMNGDYKRVYPTSMVVYFYSDVNTLVTTFSTGEKLYRFQMGQVELHFPDGRKEILQPDGIKKIVYADSTEKIFLKDGTVVMTDANGRIVG